MGQMGIITVCRKGKWHVYDVQTMKNCICDIVSEYRVGCNMFELLLDFSYKRHGALLIYDPEHKVIENIVNKESLLLNNELIDISREMLSPSVSCINMGGQNMSLRKKRIMIELASMDGALIFDSNSILAFGSMIKTHPKAGNHSGARETAFESAFLYGGRPFKVSSDGDISIRFSNGKLTFL